MEWNLKHKTERKCRPHHCNVLLQVSTSISLKREEEGRLVSSGSIDWGVERSSSFSRRLLLLFPDWNLSLASQPPTAIMASHFMVLCVRSTPTLKSLKTRRKLGGGNTSCHRTSGEKEINGLKRPQGWRSRKHTTHLWYRFFTREKKPLHICVGRVLRLWQNTPYQG